jgi:hypothetical protein
LYDSKLRMISRFLQRQSYLGNKIGAYSSKAEQFSFKE